jgi:hypothetical protein
MDNSIVPVHLAVKAMRDNGYKNAAYAIAELIDNSIQHGATKIELLCAEVDVQLNIRNVTRVNHIAVLDNGQGMDKEVLRMALQFGNGTHLETANQKGIGKFGMGLPSSSISQAKKVEVWTWQNGIENAIYSFLDIDKIMVQEMKEVPEPFRKEIPEMWRIAGKAFEKTGTLVLWSNIDRCIWKTAQAIIDNSEFIIGRMYRKFIENGKVDIKMAAFKQDNPSAYTRDQKAQPNDPIYLMEKTSCPAPFSEEAMFEKHGGDSFEVRYEIIDQSKFTHEVVLRFSAAKLEARQGHNAGAKPHGKHAGKNIGVSVVRAGRELDLDQAWVIQYDPRERWWGVEVEFPPALDEIFGVTNNKQFANNFSELGKINLDELVKGDKSIIQLKEELEEEGDPKAFLIEIAQIINKQLTAIRKIIEAQKKNEERTTRNRHSNVITSAEQIATEATMERIEEGHTGTSDRQENKSEEEKKAEVTKVLENEGVINAADVVDWLFRNNLKYSFVDAEIESTAFFSVKSKGGKILISLNTDHPAYHKLVEVLDESTEGASQAELQRRLSNASEGLKLLLMAWARYEDEQPDGRLKTIAQESRQDWGRIARKFLQED